MPSTFYTLNDCCSNEPATASQIFDGSPSAVGYLEYIGEGVISPNDIGNNIISQLCNEAVGCINVCFKLVEVPEPEPSPDIEIRDWENNIIEITTVPTCAECQECPPKCYTLTDCNDPDNIIKSKSASLEQYAFNNSIVKINGYDECWSITFETELCGAPICGKNYEGYGYLYNWFAIFGAGAQTNGGINPGGIVNTNQGYVDERNQWVVPSNSDWTVLTDYLGGDEVAGGKLKTTCTAPFTTNNGLWDSPNEGATNEVNWAGIPGGDRNFNGTFGSIGRYGVWWSSTEDGTNSAQARLLDYSYGDVNGGNYVKVKGFSVRLVRPVTEDELLLPDGTTSNDNSALPEYIGNSRSYITVKIGNQVWTAQNLIDTEYNDGTLIPEVTNGTTWSGLTTGARCSYNNGTITPDQGQIELCGDNPSPPPPPAAAVAAKLLLTSSEEEFCPCEIPVTVVEAFESCQDCLPVIAYKFTNCDNSAIVKYSTEDFSEYIGKTVELDCGDCWSVTQINIQPPSTQTINIEHVFNSCTACKKTYYKLTSCSDPEEILYTYSDLDVVVPPVLGCNECIKVSFTSDDIDYEYNLLKTGEYEGYNLYTNNVDDTIQVQLRWVEGYWRVELENGSDNAIYANDSDEACPPFTGTGWESVFEFFNIENLVTSACTASLPVISIKGFSGCFKVEETREPVNPIIVKQLEKYDSCEDCPVAPEPEPESLPKRKVKPGYSTPACDIEKYEKITCKSSEIYYKQVMRLRYGISNCCPDEDDKWIIKKELIDLDALRDPDYVCQPVTTCCGQTINTCGCNCNQTLKTCNSQ
jgi:uncharacterized protein (TIGR02145 family)